MPEFCAWPKTPRLSKTSIVITEKIDGTNACVVVAEDLSEFVVSAQSRNRIITPGKATDNLGFASWVLEHQDELVKLGPGYHYGEWWGLGIQRGYDQDRKRFSLFDVNRWTYRDDEGIQVSADVPACCEVVPTLWRGPLADLTIGVERALDALAVGSYAAPGFKRPEGICVRIDRQHPFKVLLENDDLHKSQVAA